MKNITQIKLNEINNNIYCLNIIKLQYLKNNIWFDIKYNKYVDFFNFSKYEYFQSLKDYKNNEDINLFDIKFITNKNNCFDIISILIKFITHYIINNKPEIFSNYITILKNNITSTKENIIYFNNNLFNDILNLNLDIKIGFKILNANPDIKDISIFNNQIIYKLKNKLTITNYSYNNDEENNIIPNLSNIDNIEPIDINDTNDISNNYASYPSIYDNNYVIIKGNKIIKEFDDVYYNTLIISLNDYKNNIDEELDFNKKEIEDENIKLKEENKKLKEDLKMLKMILTNPEEFFNIKKSK